MFLLKQLTCTVVISCALDWRLSAHPKRVPTFFDLSPRCVNFGAHNGCNSKPSVSSLLLITLAETSRFLETADGTDLGGKIFKARRKKKRKHPQPSEFSFFVLFCWLHNSLPVLPFPVLHPCSSLWQFMPARVQLKAFPSRVPFVSKPTKTSLTSLTDALNEAFHFDRALGFLHAPVGATTP